MQQNHAGNGIEIAIVGMAGRFPGAPDLASFWRNLRDEVESVEPLNDAELHALGVSEARLSDPDYVKARVPFDGADLFDAEFFGYTPRDAEHLDPQQRLFLECAWQALEQAGYDTRSTAHTIGLYAGGGTSFYLLKHLLPRGGLHDDGSIADLLALMGGNTPDSLCTRVAYKLNLKGPAVSVQTACSTSLMAVHMACQALLGLECDMALAGGVSLNLLQKGGYRHQSGGILSADGHCRAFDADASGTVVGSGVGIVVLKRLDDALREGDTIHAVIKGSAANNDGMDKVGFTAPSVNGQAAVVRAAQLVADVAPDTIDYVEAHGTGTTLGDPIEVAALTQAFRAGTERKAFCALGSVKTNVGHLDAAAGVCGLIKTVLSLTHRMLPASLNFRRANAAIDFANSPFYVNAATKPWPKSAHPRRAGVSAFGIGGTNVHVILEEVPPPTAADGRNEAGWKVLPLSARSEPALAAQRERLATHLRAHPEQSLADVAHTLHVGRRGFDVRAAFCARTHDEAIAALQSAPDPVHHCQGRVLSARPTVAFLFPGQGAQHPGMGRMLYGSEPEFARLVDQCSELLVPHLGEDLRRWLFPAQDAEREAGSRLEQTDLTQPALFVIEYALAQLWMSRGVRPDAMLGHSIGEYVAACLAGVFSLEDGLRLVAARGRLLQATAAGAMLAVHLSEPELAAHLKPGCDLAAVNADGLCVVSGQVDAIEALCAALHAQGVLVRRLHVSRAFHSALVEPALAGFKTLLADMKLGAPQIPFVSNLSGTWITAQQACDPDYWVRHMREAVRFADGLTCLLEKSDRLLLEAGPGTTLASLARRHPLAAPERILSSQCHPEQQAANDLQFARCQAWLWTAGVEISRTDNAGFLRRVPLPTYPFERKRHWVEALPAAVSHAHTARDETNTAAGEPLLYVPRWRRTLPLMMRDGAPGKGVTLIYGGGSLAERLLEIITGCGGQAVQAEPGARFARMNSHHYQLRGAEVSDHAALLRGVVDELGKVERIFFLWTLGEATQQAPRDAMLEPVFHAPLALLQALEANGARQDQALPLLVVSDGMEDVTGLEPLCPIKAVQQGLLKVAGQECPGLVCRLVDVVRPSAGSAAEAMLAAALMAEMNATDGEAVVAYRGPHRWSKHYARLDSGAAVAPRLRQHGVYLITGGLGGVGLVLARHLAARYQARLVLVGRTPMPEPAAWAALSRDANQPEPLRRRLRALLELQALGAQVLTLAADITQADALNRALQIAHEQVGAINGVIHAAGHAGGGLLGDMTRAGIAATFMPKLTGTDCLLQALDMARLDFVALCSSLASIAGGLGKADYAAANAYLDAVAAFQNRQGACPVFALNWDAWRDTGMAEGLLLPEHLGLDPEQGAGIFERIVNGPLLSQVIVSTTDLDARLGPLDYGRLEAFENAPAHAGLPSSRHPRPALQSAYLAAETELETQLAELWSERLGIAPIGVHDNLFELGGDSLMAIQILGQVRARYGVDIHPATLLKSPTIDQLAMAIETCLIDAIENAGATAAMPQTAPLMN